MTEKWSAQNIPANFSRAEIKEIDNKRPYATAVAVQSLNPIWFFATPWTAAHQASLSLTISWSLLKIMPIKTSSKVIWIPCSLNIWLNFHRDGVNNWVDNYCCDCSVAFSPRHIKYTFSDYKHLVIL